MSHNHIKIGSSAPNSSGVVSPSLSSDFGLASISDGEALGYTTSEGWGGVSVPATALVTFASYQSTSSFSTSTYYYDANDCVIWRNAHIIIDNSTYVTRNTASGTRVPVSTTAWTMSWDLKASALANKKIICRAVHMAKSLSGTEEIIYQWGVGTTNDLATYTPIGNKAQQNQYYTQTALGHYEMGGSDMILALKVTSVTGSVGILDGSSSFNSYLTIGIIED